MLSSNSSGTNQSNLSLSLWTGNTSWLLLSLKDSLRFSRSTLSQNSKTANQKPCSGSFLRADWTAGFLTPLTFTVTLARQKYRWQPVKQLRCEIQATSNGHRTVSQQTATCFSGNSWWTVWCIGSPLSSVQCLYVVAYVHTAWLMASSYKLRLMMLTRLAAMNHSSSVQRFSVFIWMHTYISGICCTGTGYTCVIFVEFEKNTVWKQEGFIFLHCVWVLLTKHLHL